MRKLIQFSLSALFLLLISSNLEAKTRKPKPVRPSTPQVQEVANKDTNKMAQEGVYTCYYAYRQNYDGRVSQEMEQLAGMNALNSSYAQLVPIEVAKGFATAIINQLAVLTQTLSTQERIAFWDASEQHIKIVLDEFCKGHGSQSTGDLNAHIAGQINMKKIFGQ